MEHDDPGVTVERVSDHRLKVTIDGEPVDVAVRTEYTTHHHFGRFESLDQLVDVVRRQREQGGGRGHGDHAGDEAAD